MLDDSGVDDIVGACRICGGTTRRRIEAREMMFGLRDRFTYGECDACGCVQIAAYPDDIQKYYPPGYSAHDDMEPAGFAADHGLAGRMVGRLKRLLIGRSGFVRRRFLRSASTRKWLASKPVVGLYLKYVPDPSARILDVGCGTGMYLRNLVSLYYRNVNGIDPFIAKDVFLAGRLLVRKAWLTDLQPSFDCISFHHVFEHMPDQLTVLRQTHALLAADGVVIVRIPVVGGEAWRRYRENWVQLDPPRHYYLHSERSFRRLADDAGFVVRSVDYDSFGLQFWGSELYVRDIPLTDPRSPFRTKASVFAPDVLADYEARSAALNQSGEGDQIVAILQKQR